ncbi:TPA: DotU/TssL family secretion system protein [Serratia liquefaciens]
MNEFERKIREAITIAHSNVQSSIPLSGNKAYVSSELPNLSFGSRGLTAKLRWEERGEDSATLLQDYGPTLAARGETCSASVSTTFGWTMLSKAGVMVGSWDNPLIAAAMPVLLQVERAHAQKQPDSVVVRVHLVREIQQFQQRLLKEYIAQDDADRLAYLLCSYVDECCINSLESSELNLSLLVEFYRDAWGGEKCFEHLQEYLALTPRNKNILAFYDLILSLGFVGKYHVIERGEVLLADVRNHLNAYLYSQCMTQTLADIDIGKAVFKVSRITPIRLLSYGVFLALLTYGVGVWNLHTHSQQVRNEILAWTPPVPREINIMTTIPQPLLQIVDEGWLEVRADPRGWLLIFTSDGAFSSGQSKLSDEFIRNRNIERLGTALASWPGDLEVIGHTDNKPYRNAVYNTNLKLSEARAKIVADKLRESLMGGEYNRMVTSMGKGDIEPLDTNLTEEGRSHNRRVDILWKIIEK